MLIILNSRGQGLNGVVINECIGKQLSENDDIEVSSENFINLREGLVHVAEEAYKHSIVRDHTIFMGGDHLTSFATVLSSLKRFGNNFRLIWIDAHTDIHSFNSSPSWNMHGMVLRMLLEHNVPRIPQLKPNQILYLGIRSYERQEMDYIIDNKIMCITMNDWKRNRDEALIKLAGFVVGNMVHISLDVDSMDPSIMSSTGTPVENGLMLNDILDIIGIVREYSKHVATDIMEFNPQLGDYDVSFKTLKSIVQFLEDKRDNTI